MLAKARQVDDELREDQRILEELKSFTKKEEEEESKKVLEARAKQLQWLDGVSILFLIFNREIAQRSEKCSSCLSEAGQCYFTKHTTKYKHATQAFKFKQTTRQHAPN